MKKVCKSCLTEKDIEEYFFNKTLDYYFGDCKICYIKKRKEKRDIIKKEKRDIIKKPKVVKEKITKKRKIKYEVKLVKTQWRNTNIKLSDRTINTSKINREDIRQIVDEGYLFILNKEYIIKSRNKTDI